MTECVLCSAEHGPVPVVEVDVDLDGLVGESGLHQRGLCLLQVSAEQEHVGQGGLLRGQLLNEVDVLDFINLQQRMNGEKSKTKKQQQQQQQIRRTQPRS